MEMIELLKEYIKPEVIVVAFALYFIAEAIKKSEVIPNKLIPLILGIVGIIITSLYIFATCSIEGYREILLATFSIITQGTLVAGASVYVNQIIKQSKKEE